MAVFTLQKITQAAAGRATYLRGVACYNGGGVHRVRRTSGELYSEILTAEVDSDDRCAAYHIEACFDYQGQLAHYSCACPTFDRRAGACKHIVAALVHKYYADMVSGMQSPPPLRRSAPPPARTDEIARRMMERYMERSAAEVAAQTASLMQPVELIPLLRVNGQSALLSFSLRSRREYVLRDLRAFAQAMQKGDTLAYGRSLTFFHHPDSFAEADRPLLRFLIGQVPPLPQGGSHALRELTLSPVALDAFFGIMQGREVACQSQGESSTVRLQEGDPALTLNISRAENGLGYRLECNAQPLTLIGAARRYVLLGSTLYGCTADFSDRAGSLLDALQAARGPLFVADTDMPTLCAGALRALQDRVTLTGETDSLTAFLPQTPEAEVYLDAPEKGQVVARLLFCYNEQRINPYTGEKPDGTVRDTLSEYRLRLLVERQFDRVDEQAGNLLLDADDERLYRFVTEGVEELERCAAVYVTDRFRTIGVTPPPQVSVGVRLESGLLDLSVQVEGLEESELRGVLAAYRERRVYHRLKNGHFLQLQDPALQGLYALTEGLSLPRAALKDGSVTLPTYRALYLDRVLRDNPAMRLQRDEGFRRLVRDVGAVADNEFTPPASLNGVLRNYQKTGFRWLKTMQQYGFGGILADDMGLGKTLEMISLLLDAKEQGETLPSLVVCPASLVFNWQSELARFAPTLRVLAVVGDAAQRADALREAVQYDVVLTSYDLLKRDVAQYHKLHFAYHVLDEAQYIKNAATHNARAVKQIDSRCRFALTGTPIENRLSELWSIFDFLMPGFLYSYARFRERLERPIVRDGDEQALARLERLVAPFILRRLKQDVLHELPPKHESVVSVPLEGEQRRLYNANVALLREELLQHGLAQNRITVLAMLTRLRQICCSPALCYENYRGDSAKTEACMELLREAVDGGHKVLLFSQFTSLLDLLRERLQAEQIAFYELRGSTPKEKRAAFVEAFNRDETPVFLISLKAGGTGLNLIGADMVIHFDPWWNLSAQNQATDRAHRIGQQQTVQVYKLIAKDTLEEKILLMQEQKQALADAVVQAGDGLLSSLTARELLSLLET